MPTPDFKPLGGDPTTQQIQDFIVKLIRDINFLFANLDNHNIVNVAGFLASATEFMSKNGHVGLSSDGVDPTSIRFWSGDVKTGSPNFKVTEAGILTAISALFQSAAGYPRVEMNSISSLFGAYQSPTVYVKMDPAAITGTPGFSFQNGVGDNGSIYLTLTDFYMLTVGGAANLQISSGKDLHLGANTPGGYKTYVDSWDTLIHSLTSHSLQQDLNAKANGSGISGTVYVSSTSGGPATTPITFSNGIRTS
jgi:hypothetical protein